MQSYSILEDIAHTSTRVEGLHEELKNTQGKKLIKYRMSFNVGEGNHTLGHTFHQPIHLEGRDYLIQSG